MKGDTKLVLQTKEFKEVCKTVLAAIDNKENTLLTETLELKANGSVLDLNITNREYYLTANFKLGTEEKFDAAVNASLFLKLISKLTTETIEITQESNNIKIKANGQYKLPMIFNNDKMLELPKIEIENVTNTMNINSNILHSIANYNSKELLRGTIANPVQKYYYVDEKGAITFTSGACVNSFELEKPIKVLLSDKVVKLFKLFKEDTNVAFTMGQDAFTEDLVQTKVRFATDRVILTAKLSDSSLTSSVPVSAIRDMATKTYDYSVVISKDNLLQAIQRIMLFNESSEYGSFEFTSEQVTVYDFKQENKEEVTLQNECPALDKYTMFIKLSNFALILDGCEDDYVTVNFGDNRAVVVKKSNISDIIPESKVTA